MNSIERGGPGRQTGRRTGTIFLSFLYILVMVGSFAGTAALLGPADWVTSAVEKATLSRSGEDLVLKSLIAAYIMISVLVSRSLVRRMYRSDRRRVRLAIPTCATVVAALSLWGWMSPGGALANAAGGTDTDVVVESGAHSLFVPDSDSPQDPARPVDSQRSLNGD